MMVSRKSDYLRYYTDVDNMPSICIKRRKGVSIIYNSHESKQQTYVYPFLPME